MTISIQTTKTETVEKQITIPSFFQNMRWLKDDKSCSVYEMIAFLNESTVVKVWYRDDYTSIQNGTPEEMKIFTNDLLRDDYQPIDEAKFLDIYTEALEGASLQPIYKENKESYVSDLASIGVNAKEASHD
ncbi:MAG: hypothetical protein IPQ08_05805 [Chitinophagaceae bacterium]|nr:hypothetical protein [Chitinophagaceae bacterium]